MLGGGRPFIVQCINPLIYQISPEQITSIQNQINQSNLLNVSGLRMIPKYNYSPDRRRDQTGFIKEGEETKRKSYRF